MFYKLMSLVKRTTLKIILFKRYNNTKGADSISMRKLFDVGLILNALGLVIVVILDIALDLPEGLFDILSILFIAGGLVCVHFYNKYRRIEQNDDSV